ncbi:hypothetical protein EC973_005851 [Apophysomyces ossiformis]|uniref:Uncharacterized protein n=1 Tax=Apophysomyces ossiformis TaxID=679940 RepID=A0A8H7EUQ8_9FUNG|nr:hypothetical protein EC973_005851 [Apophysomyces ossiformis]
MAEEIKMGSFDDFRKAIGQFILFYLTQGVHLRWALEFIRKHGASLYEAQPNIRRDVLTLCTQLQNTEGYQDLEIDQLLYEVLRDLQMASSVWRELINENEQWSQMMRQCDELLDQCVQFPSRHVMLAQKFFQTIPPSVVAESTFIQLKLTLYNTLFESEMALFAEKLKEMDIKSYIELSGPFKRLLQCKSAPLLFWLNSEASEMATHILNNPEATEFSYNKDMLDNLTAFAKTVDLPIDGEDIIPLLKEFGLALSAAHSSPGQNVCMLPDLFSLPREPTQ